MSRIKIIKIQDLWPGIILDRLIDERGFKTHKEFIEKFNEWKDKSSYSNYPDIREKDLSRWIHGIVKKPNKNKLKMFSDFFGVNIDYLKCKDIRKGRIRHLNDESKFRLIESTQDENLIKSLERENKISALKDYCKHLGFTFCYEPTEIIPETHISEIIEDGKLYTLEITDNLITDAQLSVSFQDGTSVIINDSQLDGLIENIEHYIEFEFSKFFKAKK